MRKFLVILFLVITLICRVSASEKSTDTLKKIEISVLGTDYSTHKIEDRLTRLEEYVYGKKKKGTTSDRLKQLAKDLNSDVIGQEVKSNPEKITQETEFPEDSSVDYPVIDNVEEKLNIKSQPTQSLRSRLVAIEKNLFNNVYDTDDFYTRVERIKNKVYKNTNMLASDYNDDEYTIPEYSAEDILYGRETDKIWDKYGYKQKLNTYTDSKISILEKKILNNTYPDENTNDRLARLESCVFDTEFYYDDENERIDRLEGAIKGKQSSNKYDNNKLQQRLNTAMQIGAMILMVLACIL